MAEHIYIHVPFCKTKCPYCDFYSELSDFDENVYFGLLKNEFYLRDFAVKPSTVYFGGGTPSVFSSGFFGKAISFFGECREVTVEVNPEDANFKYLKALRDMGVNRISIGVQTFSDRLLSVLGRRHTGKDAFQAVENACSLFENVSIDFMFGVPESSNKEFERDLKIVSDFKDLKHISLYAFTVYENTPIYNDFSLNLPKDEDFADFYKTAVDTLEENGFKRYEISNFARNGFECVHNKAYWKLKNYIGLGPSAASFVDGVYGKNIADFTEYISLIERGDIPVAERVVFDFFEFMELKFGMGLRLKEGVDLNEEEFEFFEKVVLKSEILQVFIKENILNVNKKTVSLNSDYFFVFNSVVSQITSQFF